ncbi:hypothetical protein, partial [Streptomyces sp. NPDC046985]|uniref:hypothetical protein n=1 Tax=Streptomyces sp. NPDC046985 TaxID=3155377 RepID=UPI00341124C8
LLAELLENATSFSSPQTKVKVTGHALPPAAPRPAARAGRQPRRYFGLDYLLVHYRPPFRAVAHRARTIRLRRNARRAPGDGRSGGNADRR